MKKGTHRARPIAAVLTRTQGDAKRPYIFIKFGLSERMDDCIGFEGYFGDNIDKGGKSLSERTMDVMKLCGWRPSDARNLSVIGGPNAPEVEIVVQEEEYRGESRLKVRFVQEVGTAAKFMPQPLDDREADYVFKSMERAMGRGGGGDHGWGAPPEREPGADDDINF
jgi:hypothetical protein